MTVASSYNIGRIKAENVAVGDHATVHARPPESAGPAELAVILQQLTDLRAEMQSRAATTDQELAVVAVDGAIQSARAGDTGRMAEYLTRAGRWALGVATSVGAEVAAAVIRSALGIP